MAYQKYILAIWIDIKPPLLLANVSIDWRYPTLIPIFISCIFVHILPCVLLCFQGSSESSVSFFAVHGLDAATPTWSPSAHDRSSQMQSPAGPSWGISASPWRFNSAMCLPIMGIQRWWAWWAYNSLWKQMTAMTIPQFGWIGCIFSLLFTMGRWYFTGSWHVLFRQKIHHDMGRLMFHPNNTNNQNG